MTQLAIDAAIQRFNENEERVDIFVNQNGAYLTNQATPRQVETLPSFISRKDSEINERYSTFNSRGDWTTATNYNPNDLVISGGIVYVCLTTHAAGTFATDLAAKKWAVYQGTTRQELATKDGASLIGYGTEYYSTTVDEKLSEAISICDEGASDDWDGSTGTNNFTAFSRLIDLYPNGATIRLPKKGTGVYNIVGDRYVDTSAKFLFIPDEGVSIRFVGTYSPFGIVKTTRKLPFENVNLNFTTYIEQDFENPVSSKLFFMNPNDGELPDFVSINQTNNKNYYVSWPNGPITMAVPSSTAVDSVTWASVPSNAFNLTAVSAKIGDEVSSCFNVGSFGGNLLAGVITTEGFAIIRQDVTGGVLILSIKSGSSAIVEKALNPVSLQASYKFANSLLAIKINSKTSFSVLSNGIEIVNCKDAGGFILEAGFGPGFAQNANSCSVTGMFLSKDVREIGAKPLKIVACGDSITAGRSNWPGYLRQIIAGCCGIQLLELNNIAVSGSTSTGQNGVLLSTSITGFDYCLIQIGVNDIQMSASVASFIANVTSMIDYCIANDVVPIVGVPTMWYTPAESSGGVASSNSEKGSPYRSALIRYLAANNIAINYLTLKDYGAIIPQLLGLEYVDSVVADNIHPNAYGSKVLAYSWAKTLIGVVFKKTKKNFQAMQINSAWVSSPFGASSLPTISKNENVVCVSDVLSTTSATIANGTVLITLPENLRPAAKMAFSVPTATSTGSPSGYCSLIVDTDGTIKAFGVSASVEFIYMGLTFQIAE